MQRIFKYGDIWNISFTPNKEPNILIYWPPSYVVMYRSYLLLKNVRVLLGHRVVSETLLPLLMMMMMCYDVMCTWQLSKKHEKTPTYADDQGSNEEFIFIGGTEVGVAGSLVCFFLHFTLFPFVASVLFNTKLDICRAGAVSCVQWVEGRTAGCICIFWCI